MVFDKKGQMLLLQSAVAVTISTILIGALLSVFISGANFYKVHMAYIDASIRAEKAIDNISRILQKAKKDTILLNQTTPKPFLLVCQYPIDFNSENSLVYGIQINGIKKNGYRILYKNTNMSLLDPSKVDLVEKIQKNISSTGSENWVDVTTDPNAIQDMKIHTIPDIEITLTGYLIDQTGTITKSNSKPDFVVIKATAYSKLKDHSIAVTKTNSVKIRN